MPPRYTYWTIIMEGKPTAFRARTQDELLPTLKQLQSRHPDAVLMWFARGRLWKSEEESREALVRKRRPEERRGPAWRPGGSHEDPRARFKVPRDEKRRRFRERLFRNNDSSDVERPIRDNERPDAHSTRPAPSKPVREPWSKNRPPARRPPGAGGHDRERSWQSDRPKEQGKRDRPWNSNRPSGQRGERSQHGERENRPWKPGRPAGRPPGQGGNRGRRPPGGGRRGGGSGSGSGGSSR